MSSYTFVMEVVTPLFLSGFDQTKAELRAPSIKGALRFWFRAMMGGIIGSGNTASLFEKEANLFGSTGNASRVAFVTRDHDSANTQPWNHLVQSLHWPDSLRSVQHGQLDPRQGLNYLGFSLKATRDRGARNCIIPDRSQFELTMRPRSSITAESDVRVALASLWLATTFGGIGSRSRRGFGAVRVVNTPPEGKEIPSFIFGEKSVNELQAFLKQGLVLTKEIFQQTSGGSSPMSGASTPEFCVLSPHHCEILLLTKQGRGWGTWHEALGELGWRFLEYRKTIKPVTTRKPFGLPIKGVHGDRNASPLMFKPFLLQPNSYSLLLLSFKTAEVSNSNVISTFMRNMEKQYQGVKVVVP